MKIVSLQLNTENMITITFQGKFGRAAIHIAANKGHVKNLRALMMKNETNSLNINLSGTIFVINQCSFLRLHDTKLLCF